MSTSARLLLVEDDLGLSMIVSDLLRAEGHIVETAHDGTSGLPLAIQGGFDLLILDWMLPGLTGIELCHQARQAGYDGAVLMLTARGQVQDRVQGLNRGADDYLVKPFDSDELVARVAALLRRVRKPGPTPAASAPTTFGGVVADFVHQSFTKDGTTISLAGKEADLLRFLVQHRGETVSRDRILQTVWKEQPHITPRTVDTHIAWLRQKLEPQPENPRHILTVRGEGYRFEA